MFGRQWKSLCLLAGSLTGTLGIGLEEHPDIKAITVSGDACIVDWMNANQKQLRTHSLETVSAMRMRPI